MPVPGQVDTDVLIGEHITYDSGGDKIEAYLARPRDSQARPGIIVIHEAFGPVEHIWDLTRRFANLGYNAIAPNLYTREGAPDPNDIQAVMPVMFALPDAQAVRDLEAAAAHLRALDGATDKVGCIGFCSGGRQTLLYACSSGTVDAAAPCWGGFITSAAPDQPRSEARPTPVIDLAENLGCPLYGVFGAEDENPSPEVAAELRARLERAGKTFELEIFENAGHAFLADYRSSYNEAAAFKVWPKIAAFFDKHLH